MREPLLQGIPHARVRDRPALDSRYRQVSTPQIGCQLPRRVANAAAVVAHDR
jgi:hypothetical protein